MLERIQLQRKRNKLVAGVCALAIVVVGAGAAVAATGVGTPQEESKAVIDAAAQDLGVTSTELTDALEQALVARVDAAVAAGNITAAQATELKERIASGDMPLVGLGRGGHGGPGGGLHRVVDLAAAATFLGVTEAELRTSLDEGDTLADVAQAEGKSVDALVATLVTAAKADLAQAVEDGRITAAQQQELVADLPARIAEMVENGRPEGGGRGGHHGPPPADDPGTGDSDSSTS